MPATSGGSTNVKGLDYRFDISRTNLNGFIDDTYTKLFNVSGQFNYRVNDSFKVWGAAEYKEDRDRFYWGTPIVPANAAGPARIVRTFATDLRWLLQSAPVGPVAQRLVQGTHL